MIQKTGNCLFNFQAKMISSKTFLFNIHSLSFSLVFRDSLSDSSLYLPRIWSAVIQILFCFVQSHISQIILWHKLKLFESILFIPYTIVLLLGKIFICVSEFFTKALRPKKVGNSSKTFMCSCYSFKLN